MSLLLNDIPQVFLSLNYPQRVTNWLKKKKKYLLKYESYFIDNKKKKIIKTKSVWNVNKAIPVGIRLCRQLREFLTL